MKNFTITVIHASFLEEGEQPRAVAKVTTSGLDLFQATEYAYRYTNNLDGSWSMKLGEDANDAVEVIAPLISHKGKTYGLRSTSVGDVMIVDDGEGFVDWFKVAGFGFEPCAAIDYETVDATTAEVLA
ncbi:hypothetical protein N9C48_01820 [bacterium]|nr:hypothetical protein [bacterium]